MARKKNIPGIDPGYLDKQRQALLHRHRQVIYLKHTEAERLLDLKDRLQAVIDTHPLFAGVSVQYDFDPMNSY